MTGILDTHAFVWLDSQPARLSAAARTFIQDEQNRILLSAASVWELIVKAQLGKLTLRAPIEHILDDQRQNGIEGLPIDFDHVMAIQRLPALHRDPFDRLLVAQALHVGAVLISSDAQLRSYPVQVIW